MPSDVWNYPKYLDPKGAGAAAGAAVFGYPRSAYGNGASGAPRLAFNPQGFAFTLAGEGVAGSADGDAAEARFNRPQV